MQRGLGGFPHERLHQDGSSDAGRSQEAVPLALCIKTGVRNMASKFSQFLHGLLLQK
ncbi:hypothetical protein [Moorena sp. SIO3H5]|uniref:hypothetical protein n=1 Tax=Moorena sp. SIO3H5 TaxID=2607834 RepID=UPI0013BC2D81|nr:hypothetical protein [Moorena sp. SIO3H5]NEO70313.1 hypothetical protein [Moorena sp. SIO3H5]